MKTISSIFSILFFTGLMLFATVPSNAQFFCGANDYDPQLVSQLADPLPPTVTNFIPGQFLAQTFTATQTNCSGASIIVPPGALAGSFTISLFEGTPIAPGAFLASGPATILAGGGTALATWPYLPTIPGNTYFIQIESADIGLSFFTTTTPNPTMTTPGIDEYPGGQLWLGTPFTFDLPFDIYFQVEYCSAIIIPTMGQWGLILFSFLLLSLGTVQVMRQQTVLAGAGRMQSHRMRVPVLGLVPFFKAVYLKGLLISAMVYFGLFAIAIIGFGYEWMPADFGGIVLTLPVLAYLIHLVLPNEEEMA